MYKYLLVIWLMAGFVFIAKAQSPDTTKRSVLKNNKDTLKASRQDTDVVRSNGPKISKPKVYHIDTTHSPHKAVMRSLIVPGLGQIYNHKIWKVPIVYGTLGLIGWALVFNAHYYKEYLALSEARYHLRPIQPGQPYYSEYVLLGPTGYNVPDQSIYDAKDGYRRNRDLSILGFLAFWGVQTIDAYIDAKFIHSYSLDNNFSMHITPTFLNNPTYAFSPINSYIPGIKATFTF